MFAHVDSMTLVIFGLAVCAGGYFMAAAMDSVLGPDGFGTIPNMVILITGGFLGLYVFEYMHLPAYSTTIQAVAGICGAFTSLAALAMLKALANRFGY